VIEDFDFQKLPGANEVAGNFDIGFARGGVSARVVVLCEAPSYVQWPTRGAGTKSLCATGAALWINLNALREFSRSNPSARYRSRRKEILGKLRSNPKFAYWGVGWSEQASNPAIASRSPALLRDLLNYVPLIRD
jgi:hypothetical protein